jgi:hypothetical protein
MPQPRETHQLFEVGRPRLLWTLTAALSHYSDGKEDALFTRITAEPFQVLSEHIQDVPAGWQVDCNVLSRFQAATSMVAYSKQVEDLLLRGGLHENRGNA